MFRRRTQTSAEDSDRRPQAASEAEQRPDASERSAAQAKKGRPTPKRSEAQRERKSRASVPADPKAARRAASERRRADSARMREALRTGDEKNMPLRDRGPVRRFARDYVDARRGMGEFFLPLALIVVVLGLVPSVAAKNVSLLLWPLMMVLVILDSAALAFRLRRQLRIRFPDADTRGATAYALTRSLQIRRLRAPAPKVKPGQKP